MKSPLHRMLNDESVAKPLIMLDMLDFASAKLLQQQTMSWQKTAETVNCMKQLVKLFEPDLLPLDCAAYLHSWLANNPWALAEMSGKQRTRYPLRKLLGLEPMREAIAELVQALTEAITVPLVLVLPDNLEAIRWANASIHKDVDTALDDMDIDSVSVYWADFLRTFAHIPITAVMLTHRTATDLTAQTADLYTPVANVCKHYNWSLILQLPAGQDLSAHADWPGFVAGSTPQAEMQQVQPAFWQSANATHSNALMLQASLPTDIAPEQLLKTLANVRHQAVP